MVIIALTTFFGTNTLSRCLSGVAGFGLFLLFLPIKTSNQALDHWSGNTRRLWLKQRPLSAPSERFPEERAALSMSKKEQNVKIKTSTDKDELEQTHQQRNLLDGPVCFSLK